ncbi:SDR family oxidoreductase [Altererythrobacter endophyticus]|uniref:SDR family oxidoreductase n=2 Tax=Altericroceibacterium endophyticum TaxID=1808508 RepID=A0A6I4T5R6_9SPHN|nr:SDR family oxidoreductase [Altericroceibacterium endophyticum]
MQQLRRAGCAKIYAGSRSGHVIEGSGITPFHFDLESESSLREAAEMMRLDPPQLVFVATGALTLDDGSEPEKSLSSIDPQAMMKSFAINAIGPALIAKYCALIFPREGRVVFAALSARVASMDDNRIGGWHSYRASKAALNMLLRNVGIEMNRRNDQAFAIGVHPGTVDTRLSEPFQKNLPQGQLQTAAQSAAHIISVLNQCDAEDNGHLFAWDGQRIPY